MEGTTLPPGSGLDGNVDRVHCRWMCPTVQQFSSAWPLWLLVLTYLGMAGASMAVLCRGNAKRFGFRNNYLLLQCFFCCIRSLFFTVHIPMSLRLLLDLHVALPIYLQFVTFSLLLVFLIKCLLVMQGRSNLVRKVLYPCYGVFIVIIGFATFIVCQIAGDKEPKDEHHGFDYGLAFYAAILFGALALMVATIGWLTHRMLMRIILSEWRRKKVQVVTHLLILYFLVFFGRMLWGLSYSFHFNFLQDDMLHLIQKQDFIKYYLIIFGFYAIFELLPIAVLLYTFWRWAPLGRDNLDPGFKRSHASNVNDPRQSLLPSAYKPSK